VKIRIVSALFLLLTVNLYAAQANATALEQYNELRATLAGVEATILACVALSQSSEILLAEALDMKEIADEVRQAQANIQAVEDPSEAVALMVESYDEDLQAQKQADMQAAAEALVELTAEKQEKLFGSFTNTVQIVMYITELVPQFLNIGTGIANFGMALANPMDAIAFSQAGYKPKVVKKEIDSRFANIKAASNAFDTSAKANRDLLKSIFDKHKVEAPAVAAPEAVETSSDL